MPWNELLDEEEEYTIPMPEMGEPKPVDRLSNRVPAFDPMVQSKIAERMGLQPNDPLAQQFAQDESEIGEARDLRMDMDRAANIGMIAQQAARGSAAPVENDMLAKSLASQSGDLFKSKESDLDRRQKMMAAIESRKLREATQKQTADYRKAQLGYKDDMATQRKERLASMNIGRANTLMNNPNINKETNKLNAARSVQSLINEIKSGKLKDSKNISKQLTNMIATIEMGAPGGQGDREAMGVDTLYGTTKGLMGYLSGNPNSTIPANYLNQLETEANALGDRAAQNYRAMTEGIIARADLSGGDSNVDAGQVKRLLLQGRDKFMESAGYNPETGERVAKQMSAGDESTFPKQLKKEGKMVTVSNPQEMDEAMKEGWR